MVYYRFTLVLDREPTDDEMVALFDAGCTDAVFEVANGESLGHWQRRAASLTTAITRAVHEVEEAGLRALGVRADDPEDDDHHDEYLREIAAANLMVHTRTMIAQQRSGHA